MLRINGIDQNNEQRYTLKSLNIASNSKAISIFNEIDMSDGKQDNYLTEKQYAEFNKRLSEHPENTKNKSVDIPEKDLTPPPQTIKEKKKEIASTVNEKDKDGNIIKEIIYDSDGKLAKYTVMEYDKNGNETKFINYNPDGTVADYGTYEYNDSNKFTRWVRYSADGNIKWYDIFEYDANGNETVTTYNADGTLYKASKDAIFGL